VPRREVKRCSVPLLEILSVQFMSLITIAGLDFHFHAARQQQSGTIRAAVGSIPPVGPLPALPEEIDLSGKKEPG